jgi:ribosomal protein S18 acetylase RimI-like enzyme
MLPLEIDNIRILKTTLSDFDTILWLFDSAMELRGKNGYKVWESIDKVALQNDIAKGFQFKVVNNKNILCVFSIQFTDPFIWRTKDQNDSVYLHRIVVNPNFRGQKQFEKVLNWAKQLVQENNLKFIRMDTWADNLKLINYYLSFGFQFIENYKTENESELPLQNRNLNVALLEMKVSDN